MKFEILNHRLCLIEVEDNLLAILFWTYSILLEVLRAKVKDLTFWSWLWNCDKVFSDGEHLISRLEWVEKQKLCGRKQCFLQNLKFKKSKNASQSEIQKIRNTKIK